jgi:hypothetical protein
VSPIADADADGETLADVSRPRNAVESPGDDVEGGPGWTIFDLEDERVTVGIHGSRRK